MADPKKPMTPQRHVDLSSRVFAMLTEVGGGVGKFRGKKAEPWTRLRSRYAASRIQVELILEKVRR